MQAAILLERFYCQQLEIDAAATRSRQRIDDKAVLGIVTASGHLDLWHANTDQVSDS